MSLEDDLHSRAAKLERRISAFRIQNPQGFVTGGFGSLKRGAQDIGERINNIEKSVAGFNLSGDSVEVSGNFKSGFALNAAPGVADSGEGSATTVPGCMDPTANNYNPSATTDDGSCTYTCLAIDFSATVSGSGDPGPVETDDGTCDELVLIDGSSSGSTTFTCVDTCDCVVVFSESSSTTVSWGCECSGTTAAFDPGITVESIGGTWTLTINNLPGINSDLLTSGSCLTHAPFLSLDSNQVYDLGLGPTGLHTFTFTGDITGFSYEFEVTIT